MPSSLLIFVAAAELTNHKQHDSLKHPRRKPPQKSLAHQLVRRGKSLHRTVKTLLNWWTCDNLPCHLPKMLSTQGQNHRTWFWVMMCLDGTPARPGNEDSSTNKLIQRKIPFIAFSGTRAFCGQVTGNGIIPGVLPSSLRPKRSLFKFDPVKFISCLLLFCCRH